MPVFAADLLPDATGRNLGNDSQRWNANLQSLNVKGATSFQPVPGQSITPSGAIFVATSPLTANINTTTPQNLLSCVLPAGLLNASGKVLRGTMSGTYTTQSGQVPNLVIVADLGSIEVFTVATSALPAGQSNFTWRAQWEFTVYVPGTAAQVDTHGVMTYQTGAGNSSAPLIDTRSSALGPIDLTLAQTLVCRCLFNTNTSPANICTQRGFIVEVLN